MDFERLAIMLRIPPARRELLLSLAFKTGVTLGVSYFLASTMSAWLMSGMLESTVASLNKKMRVPQAAAASLNWGPAANYRDMQKAIMDRNVFNSEGKFPDETDPAKNSEDKKGVAEFNINAPCKKPAVNIELLGTIVADKDGVSIATVQEQGYSEADIYKEGDLIIGNDQVSIVKIERNKVIINNNGTKECLELASAPVRPVDDGFPTTDGMPGMSGVSGQPPTEQPQQPPAGGDCALEEKFVQDELGPGFGTIIQKARLVPNTTDNVMNGFKIFAIDKASLFARVGLQNGDVITQVNDTSLKQPEQGFTLYQAFQDGREVRISLLRNGTVPMMLTCRIK